MIEFLTQFSVVLVAVLVVPGTIMGAVLLTARILE